MLAQVEKGVKERAARQKAKQEEAELKSQISKKKAKLAQTGSETEVYGKFDGETDARQALKELENCASTALNTTEHLKGADSERGDAAEISEGPAGLDRKGKEARPSGAKAESVKSELRGVSGWKSIAVNRLPSFASKDCAKIKIRSGLEDREYDEKRLSLYIDPSKDSAQIRTNSQLEEMKIDTCHASQIPCLSSRDFAQILAIDSALEKSREDRRQPGPSSLSLKDSSAHSLNDSANQNEERGRERQSNYPHPSRGLEFDDTTTQPSHGSAALEETGKEGRSNLSSSGCFVCQDTTIQLPVPNGPALEKIAGGTHDSIREGGMRILHRMLNLGHSWKREPPVLHQSATLQALRTTMQDSFVCEEPLTAHLEDTRTIESETAEVSDDTPMQHNHTFAHDGKESSSHTPSQILTALTSKFDTTSENSWSSEDYMWAVRDDMCSDFEGNEWSCDDAEREDGLESRGKRDSVFKTPDSQFAERSQSFTKAHEIHDNIKMDCEEERKSMQMDEAKKKMLRDMQVMQAAASQLASPAGQCAFAGFSDIHVITRNALEDEDTADAEG